MGDDSENYDVKACIPGDLSPAELAACVRIIKKGHAVDPNSAAAELPHAKVIAFARRGAAIVGLGAIKRVRPAYASNIAAKSGASFKKNAPELGYVAVDPKHRKRGLSHRIVAELLSMHKGPLFATTFDKHMKMTLRRAGFVQTGVEWEGRKAKLSLWIKS
jgi:predicted GNAT family N-acyltransferase